MNFLNRESLFERNSMFLYSRLPLWQTIHCHMLDMKCESQVFLSKCESQVFFSKCESQVFLSKCESQVFKNQNTCRSQVPMTAWLFNVNMAICTTNHH